MEIFENIYKFSSKFEQNNNFISLEIKAWLVKLRPPVALMSKVWIDGASEILDIAIQVSN